MPCCWKYKHPSHERVSLDKSEGGRGESFRRGLRAGPRPDMYCGRVIVRDISIISPSFGRWGDLPWRIRWVRSATPVWGTRHTCTSRRGPLFCRAETCWRRTRCTAASGSTATIWRCIPAHRNLYWCNACRAAWARRMTWSTRVVRDTAVYRMCSILSNYWCPLSHVLNNETGW